ncbi:protein-methionine-sulfoxide reductase heme-binding subunit MsrQ [Puniceibacterium sediminis]|uniref:Protein-methionine-sulfoxide reductase heme-binding subunit MsrQ n=1 Tax=Puniceibacterium sediminis TaxID=1608407 RepID=A0A238WR38_9RHOB|nr:protein-methionine-sulfoxide reductase heme-binding subunit MsrQ [Puniceibacterium sediminis]SNR48878.1 sulfoxide reductase heme-binding subunit YedZ [Puniceibacterium sediminis]
MDFVTPINSAARRVPIWPLYILCALPPFWFLYQGLTGGLGVEPIKALEHRLGELALQFLVAGLAITPLRRHLGVNLIRFRRMVGLAAFYYVALHLLVWLVLDVQILGQIWADILKRPYITVGMAGFVLLLPLAVTSNAWSIRKLGPKWRQLHKLVYPAVLLGALHFVMLVKGFQIEPLLYMGAILMLLALRFKPARRRQFV